MASKSKQKRIQAMNRKETATLAVIIAMIGAILAIFQNRYGQFSDIRGFYGMHFADGQHIWPFSTHTLLGSTQEMHPVEYPALTGLIMWLLSFFIAPSQLAWIDYFRLTASLHVVLFASTVFYIQKISSRKLAILFAVSPAVLYSLNRNWDIWAILPMIMAIYLFDRRKINQSAFWLAISIATKFFPLVLLMPISLYYLQVRRIKDGVKYVFLTLGIWTLINLPFMLINFRGWSYFYEFSYKRTVGSATIFEIFSKLGYPLNSGKIVFYSLNILALGLVAVYILKSFRQISLAEASFFTMFAFILFNKQYSMQYVIWLAALAVAAIYRLESKRQTKAIIFYVIWQATELLFQYSFFQNILTNSYANSDTPNSPAISDSFYGYSGLIRYSSAIFFTLVLAYLLHKDGKKEVVKS
jgi:uncharacterized membrane protein